MVRSISAGSLAAGRAVPPPSPRTAAARLGGRNWGKSWISQQPLEVVWYGTQTTAATGREISPIPAEAGTTSGVQERSVSLP